MAHGPLVLNRHKMIASISENLNILLLLAIENSILPGTLHVCFRLFFSF